MTRFRETCLCDKRCGIDDTEQERDRYRSEATERLTLIRLAHDALSAGEPDKARLLLEDHLFN